MVWVQQSGKTADSQSVLWNRCSWLVHGALPSSCSGGYRMALNEHLMRSLAPEQDTVPRASPQTSAKGRLCVEYYLSRTSVLIRERKLKWRPDPLDARAPCGCRT